MHPQIFADPSSIIGFALLGIGIIGVLIGIITSIFWLWMLIEAITNPRLSGAEKLIWVLVIFCLHILGALIYFFVGRGGART